MSNTKKAILLVNVGTPDSPTNKSVRKYLFEFLNDPFVIDLPLIFRLILVNLIIVPFRVKKSTKLYKTLWTKEGSPLLTNTDKLVKRLNESQTEYSVFFAMRYGNPSLKDALNQIKRKQFEKIIVLPLYPQYSASTTQTTINRVKKLTNNWNDVEIKFVEQFYNTSAFINAFSSNIQKYNLSEYDHIIFSYHGLPLRQIEKGHKLLKDEICICFSSHQNKPIKCYKNSCLHTTYLLAKKLNLHKQDYTISYQSRLSKNWLSPFTDDVLKKLIKQGKKRVLVVAPAFVTDCLETTVEIGIDYKEMFIEMGGEKLTLVESLNYSTMWVKGILNIIS